MKTFLINLPWQENGRFGVRAGSRWPFTSLPDKNGYINYIPFPFFLAYTTSLLKKSGKEAMLMDAVAEGAAVEKVVSEIKSYAPGLLVIETSTPSFEHDMNIARGLYKEFPHCQIVLCGPHASVFPGQILENYDFISYILIGEYEYTLLDLVNHLESGLDIASVEGLAYRKGSASIINKLRPAINNLDDLPWPERETLPIYKYNDGFANLPKPNVQIWSSRGCPFGCTFCLWPQTMYGERRYRKRNPKDVVDEMGFLIHKFDFKAVYFDDDVFNIDRNHVLDICREIKKREIKIPWAAMARADLMDDEVLRTMADAGLYAIKYGIESTDPGILHACKKNLDLNKALQIIKFTQQLRIKVHLTFCLGLPGETKETMQQTIKFARGISPDSLQFSFAIPFPGTEYFAYCKRAGVLSSEKWSDYDGNFRQIMKAEYLGDIDLERTKNCFP